MCYSPDGGDRNQGPVIDALPGTAPLRLQLRRLLRRGAGARRVPGLALEPRLAAEPLHRALGRTRARAAATPAEKLGRPASGAALRASAGDWRHFDLVVPRRADALRIRLFAGAGADLALFARRRNEPTRTLHACRAALRSRHATCRIDDPRPGRWYAGVLTRGGAVGVGFKIAAQAR